MSIRQRFLLQLGDNSSVNHCHGNYQESVDILTDLCYRCTVSG